MEWELFSDVYYGDAMIVTTYNIKSHDVMILFILHHNINSASFVRLLTSQQYSWLACHVKKQIAMHVN